MRLRLSARKVLLDDGKRQINHTHLQEGKALGRHARSARDELQEPGPLFLVEVVPHHLPEPLHHLVGLVCMKQVYESREGWETRIRRGLVFPEH